MSYRARNDNTRGLLKGERVLWKNSQWRVTNMAIEEVPTAKSSGYWIGISEIHDDMWSEHMALKNWVDITLFNEALARARELFPRGKL